MSKLNVYNIQSVRSNVAFKLRTFLTLSTNNSLQLFHSKYYLMLSDISFLEVLMQ